MACYIALMVSQVTGGKKLRRTISNAKRAAARSADKLEVGFFETAKYPDGTPVAAVAAWAEFGTEGIPERPYFRQALENAQRPARQLLRERVDPKTLVVDNKTAAALGELVKGEVQRRITELKTPPNAPATIARKGSSNPLIDKGVLRASATYKVD